MADEKRLFTLRDCVHHIMGPDLAEAIIADMGVEWVKVVATAELDLKGDPLDHIDRLFLAMLDRDAGRIDEAQFLQAAEEFRQDHRAHVVPEVRR